MRVKTIKGAEITASINPKIAAGGHKVSILARDRESGATAGNEPRGPLASLSEHNGHGIVHFNYSEDWQKKS
ncbi:MAG: hypothetical protein ABR542_06570 [Desulfonatronovibrio sp.]|nr:hypothetical protein [Desulfovibrionales bacterium]